MPSRTLRTSPVRAALAALLAGVLAAAMVVVNPPSASADIASQIRDGQARLEQLNHQAEVAAELYNRGRIDLDLAQRQVAKAQARLQKDESALSQVQQQAQSFAFQAYKNGSVGPWVVMISSSRGPAESMDQMATLNRIAGGQADLMARLATARHRQAVTGAEAKAAAAHAASVLGRLQGEKTKVLAAASQAQVVLRDLQAKQAALVQAAKDAAARRAAQAQAAAFARQAALASAAAASFAQGSPSVSHGSYKHYSGSAAQIAVQAARDQLGKPYVWGASGPDSFDCSGLTMFAYGKAGISLPHYTGDQWNAGRHVGRGQLVAGDLVFFGQDLGHMGMYLGGGNFIHAPHSGDVVKISSLSGYYADNYAGAVRIAG